MKKNKEQFKSIFKYFDSFLIIDKSVDFILIFVGLLSALGFENYIENKSNENQYKNNLTRIHTEITNNLNFADGYLDTTQEFFKITDDLMNLTIKKGASESFDGIFKIIDSEANPFEQKNFKSLTQNDFINNSLYSDIYHVYSLYDKIETQIEIPKESLNDYYYNYFSIYSKNIYNSNEIIQNYVDLNYQYSVTLKNLPRIQLNIDDVKVTSNRILKAIENELFSYGSDIESSRTYSDYYWLSYNSLITENHSRSYDYALQGVDVLETFFSNDSDKLKYPEQFSYYGRLQKNIVQANRFLRDVKKDSIHIDLDILPNLEAWEDSGVYKEACYTYFCDYYHNTEDQDKFYDYLKKIINENEEYNFMPRFISSWSKYNQTNETKDILSKSTISVDVWESYISPRKIN